MQTPRCIAIAVMTLDGKIARHHHHFTDWSSPEDKQFLREFLQRTDIIVVGHNTHEIASKELGKYNRIVLTTSVATTERKDEKLLLCNPESVDVRPLLEPYKLAGILGGMDTYTYFLERGLLDELYLTIEPLVFGQGLDLFASTKIITKQFKLESVKRLNERGSLLLHYTKL
ncbi:dihydrofolate reductase family protein [Candidatus Kaiserbacteria bacterium]|nr:dihydrofolate reductase family protein [Candidatus Kaiserbacteria bacterium]